MQIKLERKRSLLRFAVPALAILLGVGAYGAVAQKKPDPSIIVDPYNTKAGADSQVEESLSFNFSGGPDWRTVKLELPIKASSRENFLATPVNTLRSQGIDVPPAAEAPWREFTQALRRLVNGPGGGRANGAKSAGRETLTFKITITESGNTLFSLLGDIDNDANARTAQRFLASPIETLRSQRVQVLTADERSWKQLADSLNALKLVKAKPSKGDPDRPIILGSVPNSQAKTDMSFPATQLELVGQEPYDVNGSKGTRYKLSVTNRAAHPDFLWQPSQHLPPCGKNENAARTWVEIFGSPGDKRLAGYCGISSSEDLGQLWFPVPAGEKGPPCVYTVMTDRQTGKKYESNRVCSRLFTVVSGLKGAGQSEDSKHKDWIEILSTQVHQSPSAVKGGRGSDRTLNTSSGSTIRTPDSGVLTDQNAKLAQPDLSIRQFLFTPTNDKALRVHVVNLGKGASGACRLVVTVRKINGVAAGRTTHVNVPALAAGADVWLHIDAKSILPNNASLELTTFRLNVDATEIVAELNETNNEVWHNK